MSSEPGAGQSDSNGYNFGPIDFGPFTARCVKTPDRKLHVELDPLFERIVSFVCEIEDKYVADGGIRVHMNWNKPIVNLFLGPILVQTITLDFGES